MGKLRYTLVVDTKRFPSFDGVVHGDDCITVESVEAVPEPNRVQEFLVRVETLPTDIPRTRHYIEGRLYQDGDMHKVTVTEVEVAS